MHQKTVVRLAWPKPRLLLVHEHDGQTSRIYAVDLNQADDLAFTGIARSRAWS